MPNMQDITNALGKVAVFSKLDMLKGYFQVPVTPSDLPKTAITTPFGSFEFYYSTFGLKDSGAMFQRMMDNILGHLSFVVVYVYIDDILIFLENEHDHQQHLQTVLCVLQENELPPCSPASFLLPLLPPCSLPAPSLLPPRSLPAPSLLPPCSLSTSSLLPHYSFPVPSLLPPRSLPAPSPLPPRSLPALSPLSPRSLPVPSQLPHVQSLLPPQSLLFNPCSLLAPSLPRYLPAHSLLPPYSFLIL